MCNCFHSSSEAWAYFFGHWFASIIRATTSSINLFSSIIRTVLQRPQSMCFSPIIRGMHLRPRSMPPVVPWRGNCWSTILVRFNVPTVQSSYGLNSVRYWYLLQLFLRKYLTFERYRSMLHLLHRKYFNWSLYGIYSTFAAAYLKSVWYWRLQQLLHRKYFTRSLYNIKRQIWQYWSVLQLFTENIYLKSVRYLSNTQCCGSGPGSDP